MREISMMLNYFSSFIVLLAAAAAVCVCVRF